MTESEVKEIVKLYWRIVSCVAKSLDGYQIRSEGHTVKESEVANVFVAINGTLAASIRPDASEGEIYAAVPDSVFEKG